MTHASGLHGWSYSGEAWTDGDGRAVVILPPSVLLHPAGFRYELEVDDGGTARIESPVGPDGRFTIATDAPHLRVTWRLTPYRTTGAPPQPTPKEER
jgi:hypothetical protein